MEDHTVDDLERRRCRFCYKFFRLCIISDHEPICSENPDNFVQEAPRDMDTPITTDSNSLFYSNLPVEGTCVYTIVVLGLGNCGRSTTISSLIGGRPCAHLGSEKVQQFYYAEKKKRYAIIKAEGDIADVIHWISLADSAILVLDVDSELKSEDLHESLYDQASIASALRVKPFTCCVNKMDKIFYAQDDYKKVRKGATTYLNSIGLKNVSFVPCSALHGVNIHQRTSKLLWYDGPTLMDLVNKCHKSSKELKHLRLVTQTVTEQDSGVGSLMGRVHSGSVLSGSVLEFVPGGWMPNVQKLMVSTHIVEVAGAGEVVNIDVGGDGVKNQLVKQGSVACYPFEEEEQMSEALGFTAEILVVEGKARMAPDMIGYVCRVHECTFEVVVAKVMHLVDRKSANTRRNPHPYIVAGNQAVVQFAFRDPVVIEKIFSFPSMARMSLWDRESPLQKLLAVGVIIDIETCLVQTSPERSQIYLKTAKEKLALSRRGGGPLEAVGGSSDSEAVTGCLEAEAAGPSEAEAGPKKSTKKKKNKGRRSCYR